MAFSGRSQEFIDSLVLSDGYYDAQVEYLKSLEDMLDIKDAQRVKKLDAKGKKLAEDHNSSFFGHILNMFIIAPAEAAVGIAGAGPTGGASLTLVADAFRRAVKSGKESFKDITKGAKGSREGKELQQERDRAEEIDKSFRLQLKALDANFDIQASNFDQALYNVGRDLKMLEFRLDKESDRLGESTAAGGRRIRERRLGVESKLDAMRVQFEGFQRSNSQAFRKINDEFAVHFKSYQDKKGILSGYKQAALDSAEASDFFTGLNVNIAGQKALKGLGAGIAGESQEKGTNRRLNQASRVLAELNLAQNQAFQQQFKTRQTLINNLLNVQSKEQANKRTLDLQAIGLRASGERLEAGLLNKVKENEVRENYFNNLLGVLEEENRSLSQRFFRGQSTLEQTYNLAVENAERTAETIQNKAQATLEQSYYSFGAKIEGSSTYINQYGSFPSLLDRVGEGLGRLTELGIGYYGQQKLAGGESELEFLGYEQTPNVELSPTEYEQIYGQGSFGRLA